MSFPTQDKLFKKVKAAVAGGTSTQTATVDMAGYDAVTFLGSMGTAAANNGMKLGEGAVSDGSDATDLAGSKQLSDGTATEIIVGVTNPAKRYITVSFIRGTNTTIESIWAVLSKAHNVPVTNVTTAQLVKEQNAPAEGTA